MAVANLAQWHALAGRATLEEALGALPGAAELAALVEALLVAAVAGAVAELDPLETLSRAASRPRLRISQPELRLGAQARRSLNVMKSSIYPLPRIMFLEYRSLPWAVQLFTFPGANSSALSSLPSEQSSFPSQSFTAKMHRRLSPHLTKFSVQLNDLHTASSSSSPEIPKI